MKPIKSILLTIAIFASAVAMAATPVERQDRIPTDEYLLPDGEAPFVTMRGYCEGRFAPFVAFKGTVYGDMNGAERSRYKVEFLPDRSGIRLHGRSIVAVRGGEMFFADTIELRPSLVPGIFDWGGMHTLLGGTGAYEGCFGTKVTSGCYDMATGELMFSYSADVWSHGIFGR